MIVKKDKYNIAVVGATGAVGRRMLATLLVLLTLQTFRMPVFDWQDLNLL